MFKNENGQKIGSRAFSPEDLTAVERAYYSETWGFDPVADKKVSPHHPKVLYYYEASIPLENDPELRSAGVTMHARVEVDANGKSHNRIVFVRGEKSVTVACVQTAVHIATPREILELSEEKLNELAVSAGGRQVILPPWEHYAALKSFAGGIAAVGLLWLVDQIPIPEPINGSVWAVGQDTIPEPNKWKRNSIKLPIPEGLLTQILTAILSLVPEFLESLNFDALLAVGTQLLNEESQNQAITYFERATRLNPASIDAWYGLGLVYEGNEVYPPAVHAFEEVVKLDLKNADAWLHLSAERSFNGDYEGCKEAMRRWKVLTGSQWPPNL